MALQHTRLAALAFIPTSAGAIYTNPAGTKTFVRGLLLHNTSGAAVAVTLNWVPAGGNVAASNQFFSQAIAAGETLAVELPYALVLLDDGESIRGVAGSANAVTVVVLGDKDI